MRSTNLDKVERLNNLCREICQETPELKSVREELDIIAARPIYSFNVQLFGYAIATSIFTLFFGGTLADAFCALLIGPLIKIVSHQLDRFQTNPFFITILCSIVSAFLATIACKLQIGNHVVKISRFYRI